jgi:tRNA threonylcarbamoyladenosine biosynthesis protein TsaB
LSPLHILALDTTTREGSIVVARDRTLLDECAGDAARTHGERLPSDIMRALERAGIGLDDLDLLAVAAGPGSFTGLRVGIAAVQGLAMARSLRVVAVPTLEALAHGADAGPGTLVAAWMDGQRGEVFAALYNDTGEEIVPAAAGAPDVILDAWRLPSDAAVIFVGDAAAEHRALIERHIGPGVQILTPARLARAVAAIAAAQPDRAVLPHEIVPVYVRKSDAELARERRKGSA